MLGEHHAVKGGSMPDIVGYLHQNYGALLIGAAAGVIFGAKVRGYIAKALGYAAEKIQ